MAKLKIPDPRDPTNPDKVSKFGYVNVVTNLFKDPGTNYKDFLQTADDKRPDKLQGFAGTDVAQRGEHRAAHRGGLLSAQRTVLRRHAQLDRPINLRWGP